MSGVPTLGWFEGLKDRDFQVPDVINSIRNVFEERDRLQINLDELVKWNLEDVADELRLISQEIENLRGPGPSDSVVGSLYDPGGWADRVKGILKRLTGGVGEQCPDCDGTGWTERAEGPKDTDVGVVRPLKCASCHGSGRLDGGESG